MNNESLQQPSPLRWVPSVATGHAGEAATTDHAQRARARRAITCLYLQLPESIAKDVNEIIEAAFAEDDRRITQAHAQGRREGMEKAATEARRRRLGGLENIYAANELLSMECWCRAKVKEAGHE